MRRCIALAAEGEGYVSPNPLVGAVVVHNNKVIGEGYHQQYGKPHAEVNAIASVEHQELLKDSTLYVNLEPCSHFGKTPPCADLIISKGIPKVIIGMTDPFPDVNGIGIQKLEEAGIEVITDILRQECEHLNRRFVTSVIQRRPYITLKWAESVDGFAGSRERAIRISNEATRIHNHRLRHTEQAIVVGANTILADNPQLNVREWPGTDPVRIIVDPKGKIEKPSAHHVFNGTQRTIYFGPKRNVNALPLEGIILEESKEVIPQLLQQIHLLGIHSLLIEGGPTLLNLFIAANAWDECFVYRSPDHLHAGIPSPTLPAGKLTTGHIGNNQLIHIVKQ